MKQAKWMKKEFIAGGAFDKADAVLGYDEAHVVLAPIGIDSLMERQLYGIIPPYMKVWYDVEISGTFQGEPVVIEGTILAASKNDATETVMRQVWPRWGGSVGQPWPTGNTCTFYPDQENWNFVLETEKHSYWEMATPVTDLKRLVDLNMKFG